MLARFKFIELQIHKLRLYVNIYLSKVSQHHTVCSNIFNLQLNFFIFGTRSYSQNYNYCVYSMKFYLQINTVMDVLDQTKNHNGPFLFVEEDHYMAPSVLQALHNLAHFKKKFVVILHTFFIIINFVLFLLCSEQFFFKNTFLFY